MNAWSEALIGLSPPALLLFKLSLLLAAAWCAHALLHRANPRWRVLLWRCVMTGLVLLPLAQWFGPAMELAIATLPAQAPPVVEAVPALALGPLSLAPAESLAAPVFVQDLVPANRQVKRDWFLPALFVLWAALTTARLARFARAWYCTRKLSSQTESAPREISAQAQACADAMGVRGSVSVRITHLDSPPFLHGILRPVIVLPQAMASPSFAGELPGVLAHELAHVLHRDLHWLHLSRVLQALLWFHPLAWRLGAAHEAACEAVCDGVAAAHLGDAERYSQTLAQAALDFRVRNNTLAASAPMLRSPRVLKRIQQVRRGLRVTVLKRRWVAAVVLSLGIVGAALASVRLTAEAAGAQEDSVAAAEKSPMQEGSPVAVISGVALDEAGQPVPGATARIVTASLKQGYDALCPSSYADCGKSTTTDSSGAFRFEGLNDLQTFEILIASEGFLPFRAKDFDPAGGELRAQLVRIPEERKQTGHVLHGILKDQEGQPVAGAIIEPFGREVENGHCYGCVEGIDPLAVSNAQGKFSITSEKPGLKIALTVDAPGYARKNFLWLETVDEAHPMELERGVNVHGTVLKDRQPVPGVVVGVCQQNRESSQYLGQVEAATDAEGRFRLEHVPPNQQLWLYGKSASFRGRGVLPVLEVESGESGTEVDAGTRQLESGHTVSGRVFTADGTAIPPDTRLNLSREQAWDYLSATLDETGQFHFSDVPAEEFTLSVIFPGYALSEKNYSLDPLNRFSLMGRVDGDIEDLQVLMEPGERKWERPPAEASEKYQRLKGEQLQGVRNLQAFNARLFQIDPRLSGAALDKDDLLSLKTGEIVTGILRENAQTLVAGQSVTTDAGRILWDGTEQPKLGVATLAAAAREIGVDKQPFLLRLPMQEGAAVNLQVTPQKRNAEEVRLWLYPLDSGEIDKDLALQKQPPNAVWTNVIVHYGDWLVLELPGGAGRRLLFLQPQDAAGTAYPPAIDAPDPNESAQAVAVADSPRLIEEWDVAFAARDRAELFRLLGKVYTPHSVATLRPISKDFEQRLLTFYLFEYQRDLHLSIERCRDNAKSPSPHVSSEHNRWVAAVYSDLLDRTIAADGNLLSKVGETLRGEEREQDEATALATLAESTFSPRISDAAWRFPARGPAWELYLAEAMPESTLDIILHMQLGPPEERPGNPHILYSQDGLKALSIYDAFEILSIITSRQPALANEYADRLVEFAARFALYYAPDGTYASQEKYVPLFDYKTRKGTLKTLQSVSPALARTLAARLIENPPAPPVPHKHEEIQPPLKDLAQTIFAR